ncbi:MAG: hypothetical protein F2921_04685 [Actinobacteria bacterium]|uniref:Unannotated protein n=1 Tax=freshwater metagenome TaxID=449393 RepID=A0A6J7SE92_9ZZZZ|nr:hypothetical protein [Actinomycetota bacterium]
MRKLALAISIFLFTSLLFPVQAKAVDPHGPKVIYGAPVRHTLTSCATNPGAAVACIQSLTMTPKSGDTPIVGAITDLKIPGDERVADSERPIPAPAVTAVSASNAPLVLSVSENNSCHSIGTVQSLQIKIGSNWVDLKKENITKKFSEVCKDANFTNAGFKITLEEVTALLGSGTLKGSNVSAKLTEILNPKSPAATISQSEIRFRVADPGGAWEWFSDAETSFLWTTGVPEPPEPKVTQGFYNEWTFPKGKNADPANNVVLMAEFQPYKATWCWALEVCNDRREEFKLEISPTQNRDLLKDNENFSYTVTIRAPKAFEFGEVSGSAKRVIVKYGKDLQPVGGVATREIIATLSPMATARGGTPTKMAEKAEFISYGANIWIYGQNNGIVDVLGACGKIGGVQVVSNAMHSLDPTWDEIEQAIVVRLSTPHLLPDGSVNVGYLEIRMPRAAALCMWKVDLDGNIKASIAITYVDGSTPTVATVTGQRIGDDYLIVSTGFHYSSPTLRVKLSQDNAVKPADNAVKPADNAVKPADDAVKPADNAVKPADDAVKPTGNSASTQSESKNENKVAAPAIAPKKIKVINCVKGKLSRKISGANPKCPKGYVKK